MRNKIALMLVLVAFCVWNVHLVLPGDYTLRNDLIPFRPDVSISKDGHLTYAGERCAFVIVTFCIYLVTSYKPFLIAAIAIFGYLIDYVLYYNGTLFYMWNFVPVSYTLIAGIVLTFLILKSLLYD